MKSSIYMSSEKVEVIGYSKIFGKVAIKRYASCQLPEGVIMNGKIIDPAPLIDELAALRKKNPKLFKNPSLIADGSSILSKRLPVPKLSKRRYYQLISDEFADTSEFLDVLVCGYSHLDSKHILACATEKSQVESYISVFKEAGIRLKTITVGVQALINYVNKNKKLNTNSFILNVIDGVIMLSMLFNDGVNVFTSRTRLYSDDYQQFIGNILDSLAGLIQFNKSENFNAISHSYYLGLKDEDLQLMNVLKHNPEITLERLDIFKNVRGGSKPSVKAHFVYLNALLGNKSIDFINCHKMFEKLAKRKRPVRLWIPLFVCIITAIAIPIVYLSAQLRTLNHDIFEISRLLNDPSSVARANEIDSITEEIAYYTTISSQLKNKIEFENSIPAISEHALELIMNTNSDKVTINQFDFNENTGSIRINGKSASESDSAGYVEALKRYSIIDSVYYTGYSYNNEGEYNFSIDVTLVIKG